LKFVLRGEERVPFESKNFISGKGRKE